MTTTVERIKSREGSRGETDRTDYLYQVRGTDDDAEVYAALATAAPLTHDGLRRLNYEIEQISTNIWEGVVRYGRSNSLQISEGDSVVSFSTTGGQSHITNSKSTVNSYAAGGGTAPDYQGAIGATADSVNGVDITTPTYNFTEVHYMSPAVVTPAYRGLLFNLTGKKNDAQFRNLAAGECLFMGAEGTTRLLTSTTGTLSTRTSDYIGVLTLATGHGLADGDYIKLEWTGGSQQDVEVTAVDGNDVTIGSGTGAVLPLVDSEIVAAVMVWEMRFNFAGSPNKTGLTVGSITSITKAGWDYLWTRYEDAEDETANAIVKQPAAVYVEKVYDDGDLSTIGIGV